jgi:hypothetical protein
VEDDDEYISEYGLSDALTASDTDEDKDDHPNVALDDPSQRSVEEYVSERNPDIQDPE